MNWLDIVLGLLILVSLVSSARKGLSREIIGLIAGLAALACGSIFYRHAAAYIEPYVSSHWAASLGGFLIIFFGVVIAGAFLSGIVRAFLNTIGLSPLDRLLGATFGFARGVAIAAAIVIGIATFLPGARAGEPPDAVVHSRLAPMLIDLSHLAAAVAPEDLRQSFEKRYEQWKAGWRHEDGQQ